MIYVVKMIRNQLYKEKGSINTADLAWSYNQYAAIQFYKCITNRYGYRNMPLADRARTGNLYIDFELLEVGNGAPMALTEDQRIHIYSTHDKTIDVVLTYRMYARLYNNHSFLSNIKDSCRTKTMAIYMMYYLSKNFLKNKQIANWYSEALAVLAKNDWDVDIIRMTLLDNTSWLHYYII